MALSSSNILIVGLGSIGQRHCKNLFELGYKNLYAVSSGKGTMITKGLPIINKTSDIKVAFENWRPEIVFICNPSSMHMDAAIYALEQGAHIFLEKPIDIDLEKSQRFFELTRNRDNVVAVGFQLRQHPILMQIKKLVESNSIGQVASVNIHWGEYLPDWHPWEDYRKSYSAKKNLGGGVTFTLCHPFDYMRWLFGEPISVCANIQSIGLDIEEDTLHNSIWETEEGVSITVHLDYLEKPACHYMQITGSEGKISWDNQKGIAKVYKKGELVDVLEPNKDFERNSLFLDEVSNFLNAIENEEEVACTFKDGLVNLKLILAAKQSALQKQTITIN